jgi:ketosteroid isomerase-like protein
VPRRSLADAGLFYFPGATVSRTLSRICPENCNGRHRGVARRRLGVTAGRYTCFAWKAALSVSRDTAQAMSEENVEIVRRAIEAAFHRPPDWDTVNTLFDPEHELISLISRVEIGSSVGARGFADWRKRMDETGDWSIEIDEIRPAPDGRVVVLMRVKLHGRKSGAEVERHTAYLTTLRDGKIVRSEVFPTPEEALEAAGLSE